MSEQEHPDKASLRKYMEGLKDADELELLCHMAGWKETTPKHRAIEIELQRRAKKREQRVSWFALAISSASLIVSIFTVVTRVSGN